MNVDPFKEYLRGSKQDKADKGYVWSTAIGLQAVDGLTPSKYLIGMEQMKNEYGIKEIYTGVSLHNKVAEQ